ncbi:MAG: winged helix-turn-helix domain-containing protein [Phaeospirillum sp.]|nr:winged helix-turn-helix domain-containing protein [Phaeospirillum sp.]
MLEFLFGNKTKEKVLLYLYTHGEGYAQEIRQELGLPLRSVQLQLKRLEEGGILFCRERDRTIVYQLNPRFPFYKEIALILEKALKALPPEVRNRFYNPRLRPRRRGKPL